MYLTIFIYLLATKNDVDKINDNIEGENKNEEQVEEAIEEAVEEDVESDEQVSDGEDINFVPLDPKVGEYWQVGSKDKRVLFVIVKTVESDGIGVNFFTSSAKGTALYTKRDRFLVISLQDFDKKVYPELQEKGSRGRTFYRFEDHEEDFM